MIKLAKILKSLRIEKGLSQQQFATLLDVDQSTVAKWESGQREPSLEMLIKLSKFFNVPTDYLLGLEDWIIILMFFEKSSRKIFFTKK